LLGFVLGPMLEENFRRALLLSRCDMSTFMTRPISSVCMSIIFVIIAIIIYKRIRLTAAGSPTKAAATSELP
jgi:TctA family transporter